MKLNDLEKNEDRLSAPMRNISRVSTDRHRQSGASHCIIYLTDTVFDDIDEDGMADNRETEYFGTLDKNGDGDEDG